MGSCDVARCGVFFGESEPILDIRPCSSTTARQPSSASNSPSRPMPASGSAGTGVTAVSTDSSDQLLLPLAGPAGAASPVVGGACGHRASQTCPEGLQCDSRGLVCVRLELPETALEAGVPRRLRPTSGREADFSGVLSLARRCGRRCQGRVSQCVSVRFTECYWEGSCMVTVTTNALTADALYQERWLRRYRIHC